MLQKRALREVSPGLLQSMMLLNAVKNSTRSISKNEKRSVTSQGEVDRSRRRTDPAATRRRDDLRHYLTEV